MTDDELIADLAQAERANHWGRGCDVCIMLEGMSDPVQRAVRAGLAGKIGRDKLVTILNGRGYTIGRRSIERHRREGHA